MANKRDVIRAYRFSDGFLTTRCDTLIVSLTRDQGALNQYGVPMTRITGLQTLINNFLNVGFDQTFMSQAMGKRQIRDTKQADLFKEMKNLRTKVEGKWPTDAALQGEFNLGGSISQLDAVELKIHAEVTLDALAAHQAEFGVPYAIDAAYVTAFGQKITDLNNATKDYNVAANLRKTKTVARILAGNILYHEMLALCAIGQNYWEDNANTEFYNEYVLNESTTPPPVQNIDENLNPQEVKELVITVPYNANTSLLMSNLGIDAGDDLTFWFGTDIALPPTPEALLLIHGATENHIAGDINYDTTNIKLFVKNNSATNIVTAHVVVNA
ncbi:MAG: hypothetical protein NTX03_09460 [Bacteroidetes bacterium]|nr:hypothetical protein [Bacteroidota bacterium]